MYDAQCRGIWFNYEYPQLKAVRSDLYATVEHGANHARL